MNILKISHPVALPFLMTDDLYSIASDELQAPTATDMSQSEALTESPVTAKAENIFETKAAVQSPAITMPEAANELLSIPKEAVTPVAESSYFEYLGENNKYILILIDEPTHQHIAPKELETLLNILKGKKQELKDVALLNLKKYPSATFNGLKKFFACNSIILFGIDAARIGIEQIQPNQVTSFQGTKVLSTFSIAEMLTSVDKKRAFWDKMKTF